MLPANERRRYIVTSSPIGWARKQNDPCMGIILYRIRKGRFSSTETTLSCHNAFKIVMKDRDKRVFIQP